MPSNLLDARNPALAPSGSDVYVTLTNVDDKTQIANWVDEDVETYDDANYDEYGDVAEVEEQGASARYLCTVPDWLPAGRWLAAFAVRAGADPAEDDVVFAEGEFRWDGAAIVDDVAEVGRMVARSPVIWYVSPDGADTNAGTAPSAALLTPQAAHDAAADGDTIVILAGAYTMGGTPGLAISKDLTIVGAGQATRLVVSGANPGLVATNCNLTLRDLVVDAYEPIKFVGSGSNVKRLDLVNVITANGEFGGGGLIVDGQGTSNLTVVARDCWIRSAYDGVIGAAAAGATVRVELYRCTITTDINALAGVGATGTISLLAVDCDLYGDTAAAVFGGAAAGQRIELVNCRLRSGTSGLDVDASGATGGSITLSGCRHDPDKSSGAITVLGPDVNVARINSHVVTGDGTSSTPLDVIP